MVSLCPAGHPAYAPPCLVPFPHRTLGFLTGPLRSSLVPPALLHTGCLIPTIALAGLTGHAPRGAAPHLPCTYPLPWVPGNGHIIINCTPLAERPKNSEHARVTSAWDTSVGLLISETPWLGDMVWTSHHRSHW